MKRPLYTRLRWGQSANKKRRRAAIARIARQTVVEIARVRGRP